MKKHVTPVSPEGGLALRPVWWEPGHRAHTSRQRQARFGPCFPELTAAPGKPRSPWMKPKHLLATRIQSECEKCSAPSESTPKAARLHPPGRTLPGGSCGLPKASQAFINCIPVNRTAGTLESCSSEAHRAICLILASGHSLEVTDPSEPCHPPAVHMCSLCIPALTLQRTRERKMPDNFPLINQLFSY